jgi:hypothetical protein
MMRKISQQAVPGFLSNTAFFGALPPHSVNDGISYGIIGTMIN